MLPGCGRSFYFSAILWLHSPLPMRVAALAAADRAGLCRRVRYGRFQQTQSGPGLEPGLDVHSQLYLGKSVCV
jgi:hypothetical protein